MGKATKEEIKEYIEEHLEEILDYAFFHGLFEEFEKGLFIQAIELWGEEAQWRIVAEECSEVIKEIMKLYRGEKDYTKLLHECAQLQIVLNQAKIMLGEKFTRVYKTEIERLNRKIQEEVKKIREKPKDTLKNFTIELLARIEKGEKLTHSDTAKYLVLAKEQFCDNEASGLLNVLIASKRVRMNLEPEDKNWERHFETYKSLPLLQKMLMDALADGLER